jgi:hypothetical protein
MLEAATLPGSRSAVTASSVAYWSLRAGAAFCFIGHGAFGFITKEAWLPYFGVVGIPERLAWGLMPVIGAVDVMIGMSVLFAPRALPLLYMTFWGLWTALLRPLAGESVFETLERAGNYGVPFALILLTGLPRSRRDLFRQADLPRQHADTTSVERVLKWTTCLLLIGHAALGLSGTSLLLSHYESAGLPASAATAVGLFELLLAAAVATRPMVGLLLFVAVWKLGTELLFISAGAPLWEVVERAGSYAAPLALAALAALRPSAANARHREIRGVELVHE